MLLTKPETVLDMPIGRIGTASTAWTAFLAAQLCDVAVFNRLRHRTWCGSAPPAPPDPPDPPAPSPPISE
eukprot:1191945-Prorocentrum_minimum.AAC.4